MWLLPLRVGLVFVALLAMVSAASASEAPSSFVTIGEDVTLPVGGNWARATPAGDGWTFFWASGGGFQYAPLAADLTLDERARIELTGHTDLVDNQIVSCPDGSWLHYASAQRNAPNDTAYVFHYDAAWQKLGEATLVEASNDISTNDMAPVCNDAVGALVGFTGAAGTQHIFRVAEGLDSEEIATSNQVPQLMGGSLVWEEERGTLLGVGRAYGRPVQGARLDVDAQPTGDGLTFELAAEGEDAYWPQSVIRIGDRYVMAFMWRVDDGSFAADEGNVRLAVFDLDWNLLEVAPITDYVAPTGGMRPGLAHNGDKLLVSWDRETTPHVALVELVQGFGGEEDGPGDTSSDDTAPDDTSLQDTSAGSDSSTGCGCSASVSASTSPLGTLTAAASVLVVLAARHRRR